MTGVDVGHEIPSRDFRHPRDARSIRRRLRSFNVIHWNERIAHEVGLPDVIAHGMLTMGMAIQVVTDWCEDPSSGRLRLSLHPPVVVPDDGVGATST